MTRNKRRRFRPIRDSDTEMRGSYSAPDWLKQQHTHTHTRAQTEGWSRCLLLLESSRLSDLSLTERQPNPATLHTMWTYSVPVRTERS